MKFVKKIVKWSAIGGALGAAYGAGRMKPKPKVVTYKRYSPNRILRKGK